MPKLTSKGQVTIPIDIRERLGLSEGSVVEFEIQGDVAVLRKTAGGQDRGRRLVAALRGKGDVAMTTDEIMALTRDG
jgi:antitoxin PrlF